ncbi:MAG: CTP synthetase [Donghicola eburneus]|nr:CTP synthetase [Donghicola eburneus]MCI5039081.1 CTP synthetase [Donghicola eburneus]
MTQVKAGWRGARYPAFMFHLLLILHLFIGATLAGVGIVVVLVAGFAGPWPLVAAVVGGFGLAFPVAHAVAKALHGHNE